MVENGCPRVSVDFYGLEEFLINEKFPSLTLPWWSSAGGVWVGCFIEVDMMSFS